MRRAVVVVLETDCLPRNILHEIVSHLEFEPATHTTVHSVVVLNDDGKELAVYNRRRNKNDCQDHAERQRQPGRKTRRR